MIMPILPVPMIPTVLPCRLKPTKPERRKFPSATRWCACGCQMKFQSVCDTEGGRLRHALLAVDGEDVSDGKFGDCE